MSSTASGWYIFPMFVVDGRIVEPQGRDYTNGRISSTVDSSAAARVLPSASENALKNILTCKMRNVTCNASFMEQRFKSLSLN